MAVVGEIRIDTSVDNSGAVADLKDLEKLFDKLGNQIADAITKAFSGAEKATNSFSKSVESTAQSAEELDAILDRTIDRMNGIEDAAPKEPIKIVEDDAYEPVETLADKAEALITVSRSLNDQTNEISANFKEAAKPVRQLTNEYGELIDRARNVAGDIAETDSKMAEQISKAIADLQRSNVALGSQRLEVDAIKDKLSELGNVDYHALETLNRQLALVEEKIQQIKAIQAEDGLSTRQAEALNAEFERLEVSAAKLKDAIGLVGKPETTAGYKELENTLHLAEENLDSLGQKALNAENRLQGLVKQGEEIKPPASSGWNTLFSSLVRGTQSASLGIKGMTSSALALDAALAPIAIVIVALTAAANAMKAAFNRLKETIGKLWEAAKKLASTLASIVRRIADFAKKIKQAAAQTLGLQKNGNILERTLQRISKTFTRVWGLIKSRLLRGAITNALSGVTGGLKQIAAEFDSFNGVMSQGASSVQTLKNSIAAALAPALAALMPIITTVINAFVRLFEVVGALFSLLFGTPFYTAKNAMVDFAGAAGGAAGSVNDTTDAVNDLDKALNKLSIDELNTITETANSAGNAGGGGGGSASDWFTEMETPSFEDIFGAAYDWAFDLTTQFLDFLSNINWDEVERKARAVGEFFGNLVNGAVDAWWQHEDPRVVGRSIAKFLNAGLQAVDQYLLTLEGNVIDGLNTFQRLGRLIGENIDEAVKTFDWNLLARDIVGLINGALQIAGNALEALTEGDTFYTFGNKLFNTIGAIFRDLDWDELGGILVNGINGAIAFVQGTINGWNEADVGLGTNLANLLMRVVRETNWADAATALSDGILLVLGELNDFISGLDVADIVAAIQTFLANIKWDEIKEALGILWDNVWEILLALPEALDIPWLGSLLETIKGKFDELPGVIQKVSDVLSKVGWAKVLEIVAIIAGVLAIVLGVQLLTSVLSVAIGFFTLYPVIQLVYGIFLLIGSIVDFVVGGFYALTGQTEKMNERFADAEDKLKRMLDPFSALKDAAGWAGKALGIVTEETENSGKAYKSYGERLAETKGLVLESNEDMAESSEDWLSRSLGTINTYAESHKEELGSAYEASARSAEDFQGRTNSVYGNLTNQTGFFGDNVKSLTGEAFNAIGLDAESLEKYQTELLGTLTNEYDSAYNDTYRTSTEYLDKTEHHTDSTYDKIFGTISDVHTDILENLDDTIDTAETDLEGFGDTVERDVIDQLTKAWEAHGAAFMGVVDEITQAYKGAMNLMIGYTNSMISGVTSAINVLVEAINNLQVDVPDWVPDIGGQSFKPSLSTISAPSIPRLARGAVIPANSEFLAVLGDQRRGTNIEAPEDLIRKIVREEAGGSGLGVDALRALLQELGLTGDAFNVAVELDGRDLTRGVRKYEDKLGQSYGGPAFATVR